MYIYLGDKRLKNIKIVMQKQKISRIYYQKQRYNFQDY